MRLPLLLSRSQSDQLWLHGREMAILLVQEFNGFAVRRVLEHPQDVAEACCSPAIEAPRCLISQSLDGSLICLRKGGTLILKTMIYRLLRRLLHSL